MNKVLIIGNGFDLFHYLPTRYSDFIYVLNRIEHLDENKQTIVFGDLFGGVNSEENICEIYANDWVIDREDIYIIYEIKNIIEQNSWYKYFKEVNNIKTWIDFEQEILKVLKCLSSYFKIMKDVLPSESFNPNLIHDLFFQSIANNNKIEVEVRHVLRNFIPSTKETYWLRDKKYVNVINNGVGAVINNLNEREILNWFADELDKFTSVFNVYFNTIVNKFYQNQNFNLSMNKDKPHPINFWSDIISIKKSLSNFALFFTFNYTPTLEFFYKIEKNRIQYLHGQCGENQNMVLGVHETEALMPLKMFRFTKYYQKLIKNTDYQFLTRDNTFNIGGNIDFISLAIKNEKINGQNWHFYIWGHSLDISDEDYIRELFAFGKEVIQTKNCFKITVFYYESSPSELLQNLLFIMGRETIEEFMKTKRLCFVPLYSNHSQKFELIIDALNS